MIIISSAELRISVIIGLRRFSKGIVYKFILSLVPRAIPVVSKPVKV